MSDTIKTIDAAQFSKTVFLRLVVKKPGTRAKVRSIDALQTYISQYHAEIMQARAAGTLTTAAAPAVDNLGDAANGTVKSTKALFIPIPATKENGRQVILDPVEKANRFLSDVKARLCGRFGIAQPSRIMDGLFVLPEGKVGAYKEEIEAAQQRLALEFLPEIMADYDAAIDRARTAPLRLGGLGPLFDAGDYLSAEDFIGAFKIDCLWLKLGVPDNLPKELQDQFRADFNTRAQEAQEEIFAALRAQFQALIAHAQEVLTPGADGKAKKFHASSLENIRQFTAVFADRDLFNDTELQGLVAQARTVLTGIDADKLRSNGNVRDQAAASFGTIRAELDKLVTVQTSRKYDFSEA
jgi:hypothetical protein